MAEEMFFIVDVGCIECGEQTEMLGWYSDEERAAQAFDELAKERDIEKWEPRGGMLEFMGLYKKSESSFLGGCGYFTRGQRALELHVLPPRNIEGDKE